ncbi:MAG: DAHL domain-containing protein [Pseudomonadota bacterium]
MKPSLRLLLVGLILAALTSGWLYLYTHSRAISADQQKATIDMLKDIKQMDSNWNTDILKSQTEIIRSYDPLAFPLPHFAEILATLDVEADRLKNAELQHLVDEIRAAIEKKASLIDKFKAQNALLKNSLHYAPTAFKEIQEHINASKASTGDVMRLENNGGLLLGDAMRYNSLPDAELAKQLKAGINKVREVSVSYPPEMRELVDNLLLHLEAVLRLRPKQIDLLREISQVPIVGKVDALGNVLASRFNAELEQQFTYQRFLLFYSAFALLLIFGSAGVITYRNVTERKRLAELVRRQTDELRKSAAHFEAMDEASPLGSFVVNETGICLHVNPMFQKITGYSAEAMRQAPLTKGIHPDDKKRVLDLWKEAVLDDRTFSAECRFLRDDASVTWVSYKAAAMRDDGRLIGYVGTLEDISGRKNVERMKNEFVATVSHELRTPLTSILGSLGLLIGGAGGVLSVEGKTLVEIAKKNSERLIRLISNILDIEKIESGSMHFDLQPLELQALMEHAVKDNEAYGAQFDVSFLIAAKLPELQAKVDADRLIQVMTNLMANAVKFSPAGGTVELSLSREGHMIRFAVADRGPGIPESFRDRIFHKFSQADASDTRQKSGTGLGLSISKAIIETMNGKIGFLPRRGGGTIFYFDLPEWKERLPAAPKLPEPAQPRPKILVCEDDEDNARLLCVMLDNAGYTAVPVHDAASARRMLAAGNFAAMTLDIGLPDIDGKEFLRQLRSEQSTQNLPVIVVSGNSLPVLSQDEEKSNLDVVDWIDKPVDQDRLITALKRGAHTGKDGKSLALHVEDDPDVRHIVASLCAESVEFEWAADFQQAAELLSTRSYDLIILDLELPDRSGWDLLPLIDKLVPRPHVLVFSGVELSPAESGRVTATLVKSHVSNPELLEMIQTLRTKNV